MTTQQSNKERDAFEAYVRRVYDPAVAESMIVAGPAEGLSAKASIEERLLSQEYLDDIRQRRKEAWGFWANEDAEELIRHDVVHLLVHIGAQSEQIDALADERRGLVTALEEIAGYQPSREPALKHSEQHLTVLQSIAGAALERIAEPAEITEGNHADT